MHKEFFKGFEKYSFRKAAFKRHVIVLQCDNDDTDLLNFFLKERSKFPTVKVKVISVRPGEHDYKNYPTIMLLRDGKEKRTLSGDNARSKTLISKLFQDATV